MLLGTLLRSLVENFRADLNKPVNEAFRVGSIGFQFHANAAIDGITLRCLECAASHDCDSSTKDEDVVDPLVDPEVITLTLRSSSCSQIFLPATSPLVNCSSCFIIPCSP